MPPISGHGSRDVVNVASSDTTRSSRRPGGQARAFAYLAGGLSPPAQIFTSERGYAAAVVFTDRARDLVITDIRAGAHDPAAARPCTQTKPGYRPMPLLRQASALRVV